MKTKYASAFKAKVADKGGEDIIRAGNPVSSASRADKAVERNSQQGYRRFVYRQKAQGR
ncbi:MAG: hypothetical protein HQL10_13775 [Nitrospirae bacterium]|nr:hypothetical protein [Nitrospirota bacterium]